MWVDQGHGLIHPWPDFGLSPVIAVRRHRVVRCWQTKAESLPFYVPWFRTEYELVCHEKEGPAC